MTLNQKQVRILIGAAVIFVAMGLFPPWTFTLHWASVHREKPAGYALIAWPPKPGRYDPEYGVRLDIRRLFVQWLVLVAATSGLLLLTRETDSK